MPVGRLTYQERQHVAAGLAKGLGFAEIARVLGRPGSTISREVARNGGARHYRANRAEQATRWRARRRKPYPHPSHAVHDGENAPLERREFEERFAEMMIQTGLPAMMAKMLACLFTSDTGSMTASELVARLQVSPASVSKAAGWLAQRGLVGRERDGRRQRYRIDEHIWYQAWLASLQSMAQWADLTKQGAQLFGDSQAGARMHAASQFFQYLGRDMTQAAEHWRQTLAGGR
jgi:DNA-binding transcriptional ArsR family regulator